MVGFKIEAQLGVQADKKLLERIKLVSTAYTDYTRIYTLYASRNCLSNALQRVYTPRKSTKHANKSVIKRTITLHNTSTRPKTQNWGLQVLKVVEQEETEQATWIIATERDRKYTANSLNEISISISVRKSCNKNKISSTKIKLFSFEIDALLLLLLVDFYVGYFRNEFRDQTAIPSLYSIDLIQARQASYMCVCSCIRRCQLFFSFAAKKQEKFGSCFSCT